MSEFDLEPNGMGQKEVRLQTRETYKAPQESKFDNIDDREEAEQMSKESEGENDVYQNFMPS